MNTAAFDTLSAARSLEAAGIESKQAEAIVGAIRSSGEASVTKPDLMAAYPDLAVTISVPVPTSARVICVSQHTNAGMRTFSFEAGPVTWQERTPEH